METEPEVQGLIGWFAKNHVAANLVMFSIIGLGIWSVIIVKKEMMPEFRFDLVSITGYERNDRTH